MSDLIDIKETAWGPAVSRLAGHSGQPAYPFDVFRLLGREPVDPRAPSAIGSERAP